MNKKQSLIITIISFVLFATFISAFIIIIRTVNVFKSPYEIKYKIEYITIEKTKIWMMENQQKDYDKKTHDKKIYFFMSDKIINNETEIFYRLTNKFNFPKNQTYYIYVYKKSKSLPKYWAPDENKFVFDIIDMHENDLYMILECKNDLFINIFNAKDDNRQEEKNIDVINKNTDSRAKRKMHFKTIKEKWKLTDCNSFKNEVV